MKKKEILRALNRLSVPRGTHMIGIKHVLVESVTGGLNFSTNPLDMTTSVFLKTKHPRKVYALVDLKELKVNIKHMESYCDITFRSKPLKRSSSEFLIQSSNTNITMEAMGTKHVHIRGSLPTSKSNSISKHDIKVMHSLRNFVAGHGEIRIAIAGVYYDKEEDALVGTNGHILGMTREIGPILSNSAIIPKDSIIALKKLMGSCNEITTKMNKGGTWAYFTAEDCAFSTCLIEGPYPPYLKVIDSSAGKDILTLNMKKMDTLPPARERLGYGNATITCSNGNAICEIELKPLEGSEKGRKPWSMDVGGDNITFNGVIGFNPDMLFICDKFIGVDDIITLHIGLEGAKAVKLTEGIKTALIMPIRL